MSLFEAIEGGLRDQVVPRPVGLNGPRLCHFLQGYRHRSEAVHFCLEPEAIHIDCVECSTPPRLNLGCGMERVEGWIGVDILGGGRDLTWDLNFPLPWPRGSVAAIVAKDVLEHLDDWHEVLTGWCECLQLGGVMTVRVPDGTGENAYRDPTHRNVFSRWSLDYLCDDDIYGARAFARGIRMERLPDGIRIPNDLHWQLRKVADPVLGELSALVDE